MRKKVSKENKKNKELSDYPVIYSYIYEREVDDIQRLANKMKAIKGRKKPLLEVNKTIIRYKVENGKIIPVYAD